MHTIKARNAFCNSQNIASTQKNHKKITRISEDCQVKSRENHKKIQEKNEEIARQNQVRESKNMNFNEIPSKSMTYVKILQYIKANPGCTKLDVEYRFPKSNTIVDSMNLYCLINYKDNSYRITRAGEDVIDLAICGDRDRYWNITVE